MIKTRFAPSPTGSLHIGSVRTALFCWLFAKKNNGMFLVRVEDTDLVRSTQKSTDIILNSLDWLNIASDEPIIYQTKRLARYKEVVNKLLEDNMAYKCYCSKERLDKLRELQLKNKQKPKYDGFCRNLSKKIKNESYVIRFKNSIDGYVKYKDLVFGEISVSNTELDDLILIKSDGMASYNFAASVDDMDMGITHIIRGSDHINNTPRQINILRAIGQDIIPRYGHLPMILGSDGKKLSKRCNATNILDYKNKGFLPQALLNYLLRLGWSHKNQEIFSKDEMKEMFSIEEVNRAPAIFDIDKLLWTNQQYIKKESSLNLERIVVKNIKGDLVDNIGVLINEYKDRAKTLDEFRVLNDLFYKEVKDYNFINTQKFCNKETVNYLDHYVQIINNNNDDWSKDYIKKSFKDVIKYFNIKFPDLAQPLRIALLGDINTLPIDGILFLLGREKTMRRVRAAIDHFQKKIL